MKSERDADRGMVFNIQKFSLQDGPGIRTTVFLKGCPLRCRWCSNPESQLPHAQIMIHTIRCIGCRSCINVCQRNAILFKEGRVSHIERGICDLCRQCADVCPSKAIETTGRVMSVSEVMAEVLQDRLFYVNSNGGVTFSGGEPLAQPEFLLALLRESKKELLHTALDTCGYAPWECLETTLDYVNLILYDHKHTLPDVHAEWTGVDNRLIRQNLKRIAGQGKVEIWIRVPVIPGFNDKADEIDRLRHLVNEIRPTKVSLLPYHTWGAGKYERLGLTYDMPEIGPLQEEDTDWMVNSLRDSGVDIDVGL